MAPPGLAVHRLRRCPAFGRAGCIIRYNYVLIFMWICKNLRMSTSKFKDEFGCVPRTHVEASLKEWPNYHVRGCILEELLVHIQPHIYLPDC